MQRSQIVWPLIRLTISYSYKKPQVFIYDYPDITNTGSQQVSPNISYVSTGGNVTLTCNHPSHPTASVRWIQGGPESLSNQLSDPRLVPSGSQLSIESFHAIELAGQYSCVLDPPPSPSAGKLAQSLVSCPGHVEHARKCACDGLGLGMQCACMLYSAAIIMLYSAKEYGHAKKEGTRITACPTPSNSPFSDSSVKALFLFLLCIGYSS